MSEPNEHPVALLLDAENVTSWCDGVGLEWLLTQAAAHGPVRIRRAYGNWAGSPSSLVRDLNRLGFDLVHVYHPTSGKNSADIHMTVDAMDLLASRPDIGTFVLATGDSDFSPLFRRLRERGKDIVGCGPRSALSDTVGTSCVRFVHAEELPRRAPCKPVSVAPRAAPPAVPPAAPRVSPAPRSAAPGVSSQADHPLSPPTPSIATPATPPSVAPPASSLAPPASAPPPAPASSLSPPAGSPPPAPAAATPPADAPGAALVAGAIAEVEGEISLPRLRERIVALDSAFCQKALGFKAFHTFLRAHPSLVSLRCDERGVLQASRVGAPLGSVPLAACEGAQASRVGAPVRSVPASEGERHASRVVEPLQSVPAAPPDNARAPDAEDPALLQLALQYEAIVRPTFGARAPAAALCAIYGALAGRSGPLTRKDALRRAEAVCAADITAARVLHLLTRVRVLCPVGGAPDGVGPYTVRGGLDPASLPDLVDAAILRRLRTEAPKRGLPWEPAALRGLLVGPVDEERLGRLERDGEPGAGEQSAAK